MIASILSFLWWTLSLAFLSYRLGVVGSILYSSWLLEWPGRGVGQEREEDPVDWERGTQHGRKLRASWGGQG